MADGFTKTQADPGPLRAAATIFVVESLVDDVLRASEPGRTFKKATDVDDLAEAVVGLWDTRAEELNGVRVMLVP
jgi:3-oxoacyl-[acyl-carrier protein] reductase